MDFLARYKDKKRKFRYLGNFFKTYLKVYNGIIRAFEKRHIDNEKIEETLDKIEREILTDYSGEIRSSELGDKILSYLIDLDEIAYVRFASVYKKFDSLDSFIREIEKIRSDKKID